MRFRVDIRIKRCSSPGWGQRRREREKRKSVDIHHPSSLTESVDTHERKAWTPIEIGDGGSECGRWVKKSAEVSVVEQSPSRKEIKKCDQRSVRSEGRRVDTHHPSSLTIQGRAYAHEREIGNAGSDCGHRLKKLAAVSLAEQSPSQRRPKEANSGRFSQRVQVVLLRMGISGGYRVRPSLSLVRQRPYEPSRYL
jgi:hypothetical protein